MPKLLVVCQDSLDPTLYNLYSKNLPYHHSVIESCSTVYDDGLINTWPIWTTFATGLRREEHGIDKFCKEKDGKKFMWTRDDIRNQDSIIYKELNNAGMSVGWVSLPVTAWPVGEIDGFMVTENPGANTSTYPESADSLLRVDRDMWIDLFSHRMFYGGREPTREEWTKKSIMYLKSIDTFESELTNSVIDMCKEYPVDVLFVYYSKLDRICHQCLDMDWIIKGAYRSIDSNFKKLHESINPEVTMIISDHGVSRVSREVVKCEYPPKYLYDGRDSTYITGDHRNPGFIGASNRGIVFENYEYHMSEVKNVIKGVLNI